MKVGIMGGTFDPIHQGHLIAAESAREGMLLDEVWFMPSNVPPHKKNAPGASADHRLEMVRLAVSGHPQFRVIEAELQRGGTSYTVDTVREMKLRYPDIEIYYIIGADMVQYLPHWHQIDEIVENISFIGLARPGFETGTGGLPPHIAQKVTLVPMPMIEISSTDIRQRRKHGKSVRFLVPDQVLQFIGENRLYGKS